MAPAGVSYEKEQGHPRRQHPFWRRNAGRKRSGCLTSRTGINQHHEFIVTARPGTVVSSRDPSGCVRETTTPGTAYARCSMSQPKTSASRSTEKDRG
jgi:hypothetical protein